MYHSKRHSRGFTLIEVLLVIGILAVLMSVVMPTAQTARVKGQVAAAQLEISSIKAGFGLLYEDTGLYPNGASDFCRSSIPADNEIDLSLAAAGLSANGSGWAGWAGPYVSDLIDPWGNPYYFDEDYQCFASTTGCLGVTDAGTDSSVIVSCGPNGVLTGGSCDYDEDNVVFRLCDG